MLSDQELAYLYRTGTENGFVLIGEAQHRADNSGDDSGSQEVAVIPHFGVAVRYLAQRIGKSQKILNRDSN